MCAPSSRGIAGVRQNLAAEADGALALGRFGRSFPELQPVEYDPASDLDALVDGASLVIVHEWNDPSLVARLGALRVQGAPFTLLFHDTHHRAVSEPAQMQAFDLSAYDGVLAFGATLAEVYRDWGWGDRVFVWHEGADTRLFHPPPVEEARDGLVWIGNWGDGERSEELQDFLLRPAAMVGLPLDIHGVRYPPEALATVAAYGARYRGWLPNTAAPGVFARHLATVHVPRRFYVETLPGIPTIRVFEALACGIPLVSAPWSDSEGLFQPGNDYLLAQDGEMMTRHLRDLMHDAPLRASLAAHGLATIRARHTCAHRADELLAIFGRLRAGSREGRRLMRIAFYGSSLLSSYWNGAATYYRGLLSELAKLGHGITFYEPDAFDRQANRDIDPPDWARVVVYPATEDAMLAVVTRAAEADVVVKASGVGVFDDALLRETMAAARPDAVRIFWDVDAPATLAALRADPDHPLHAALLRLDFVMTYGGGDPVVEAYRSFGAARCVPVYNALDPASHHPVPPDPAFAGDLNFLANRLPDREARVESFFLAAAERLPDRRFLLGGSGWHDKPMPSNVRAIGHVPTAMHNGFNCSALAVLNVARDSMAEIGFSPATRVFEAAGAGSCLITDAWRGIELFLEPDEEILVARDGQDVADHLAMLTPARASAIGEAARARILAGHTYEGRARLVDRLLREALAQKRERMIA